VGGSQEEGTIFRIAGLVEAEHGKLVASGRTVTVEEMFDRGAERIGDAADVATELAGTIGLPLGNGAAADLAGGREFILREAPGAAQGANAGADGWLMFHGDSMGEAY